MVWLKNDVIVSIENLHVNLMTTRGVVCAVRGADLDIKKGEIHGLVGESGCGKTMTSKSILRLHDEKRMLYEGSIKLRDSQGNIKDILQLPMNEVRKMRGSEVSMIFQDPVVSLNPLLTIGNQMVEMLRTHYQDMTKDQAKQKTLKLLDLVGIKPAAERYKQYPFEFSGGMLQEMGVKGAGPAAESIKPDIAICFDVCFGATGKEMDGNNRRNYLGEGPAIMLYDWNNTSCLGNIVPTELSDALISTANEKEIPYQIGVTLNCGTDAALISLSGTGVKTAGIGIPNRYMHSAIGTVDLEDINNAGKLVAAYIQKVK